MAKLKYVGPFDALEPITLPSGTVIAPHTVSVNGENRPGVARGKTFDVDDQIVGRAPDPRLAAAMVELHDAVLATNHTLAAQLRDEIVGLDHGDGLLAQVDNFVVASPASDNASPKAKGADK